MPDTIEEVPEEEKQYRTDVSDNDAPHLHNNISVAEHKVTDTNPLINTNTLAANITEIAQMVSRQQDPNLDQSR